MMLPDRILIRRRHIMKEYGVTGRVVTAMVDAGTLTAVHLQFDAVGRPTDRALFRRGEVIEKMGGAG